MIPCVLKALVALKYFNSWTDPLHGCLVGMEELGAIEDQEGPPGEVPEPDLEVRRVPSTGNAKRRAVA